MGTIEHNLDAGLHGKLLGDDEPAPVSIYNKGGSSPLLIVADHAGMMIPRALGTLGVSEEERARHIGWDIGIAPVCKQLADELDACLIQQNYSRLVIDCNRPPGSETSMPIISESTPIPGNVGLSDADKAARIAEIFTPYHEAIANELDRRKNGAPAGGIDRDAQLHAGLQRRDAALACGRLVQPGQAFRATPAACCWSGRPASWSAITSLTASTTLPITPFRCTANGGRCIISPSKSARI